MCCIPSYERYDLGQLIDVSYFINDFSAARRRYSVDLTRAGSPESIDLGLKIIDMLQRSFDLPKCGVKSIFHEILSYISQVGLWSIVPVPRWQRLAEPSVG
jgi:hypothetical protein